MFKRLGIYKSILVSYLLILILPFSVLLYIVINSISENYEQRILDDRQAALEQTAELLDLRLWECQNIAAGLSSNPLLSRHLLQNSGYDGLQAIRMLQLVKGSNEFLFDVGVFYYGDNFITMSHGMVWKDVVLKNYGLNEAETRHLWRLIDEVHDNSRLESIRSGWRLCYYVPIPFNYATSNGIAIFLLEGAAIGGLFPKTEMDAGNAQLLMDESGNILYSIGSVEEVQMAMLDRMKSEGIASLRQNGYVIQMKQSKIDASLYIAFVNEESALKPTLGMYSTVLLCSGVLLAACLMLATWFTMRMWMPIRDLGSMLRLDETDNIRWEPIQGALRDTLDWKTKMEDVLENHYQVMRENLLLRLLHGQIGEEYDLRNEMQMVGLAGDCDVACVLAVILPEARYADLVFDRLDRHSNCVCAVESGAVNCVVAGIFLREEDGGRERARRIAEEIIAEIKRVGGTRCVIGVGHSMPLERLNWSYLQAMAALRSGGQEPFMISYIDDSAVDSPMLPELREKEMIFALALGQGNYDLAVQMMDEMMNYALNNAPSVYKYTCYCLLNRTIKACEEESEMDKEQAKKRNRDWHVLAALIDETSSKLFLEHLKAVIYEVCNRIRFISKQREDKYTCVIENFIRNNYTDKNFSLASLTSEFGSTATYWSRFIKEKLDQNFSDYVWQLRLNLAKELLRTTDLAVKDVVDRVGYLDTRSFIRKFKSTEGVTPGQYKTMYSTTEPKAERKDDNGNPDENVS